MEKWLRLEQQRVGISSGGPKQSTLQRKASCCARCMAATTGAKAGIRHVHVGANANLASNLASYPACNHPLHDSLVDTLRSSQESPEPLPIPPILSQAERASLAQDTSGEEKLPQDLVLRRRRSCIKRSSSDAVKTVSWVDNKAALAAQDTEGELLTGRALRPGQSHI